MNNINDSQLYNTDNIIIKGARVHNLKNIDLIIPKNKLVVITGLSGSGKSSLAFDTLYAEGQRRYVESLSSYARQFLGKMKKPDVDCITGISPAIAIEQKVLVRNSRSTVGTSTEIYEYLKLLYARIGVTYSPISGTPVVKHQVKDVVDFIFNSENKSKVYIYAPLVRDESHSLEDEWLILAQKGFTRIQYNEEVIYLDDKEKLKTITTDNNVLIFIDRLVLNKDGDNAEDIKIRLSDSVQIAFYEGKGKCIVGLIGGNTNQISYKEFSNKFEADGISFEEPNVNFFSFNNPLGACRTCEGFGSVIGIDENLVVPDKNLSIYEDAIACWRGEKMKEWKDVLVMNAYKFNFPIHKPYYELTPEQRKLLWEGNEYFYGLNQFFKYVEEQSYKIQYRVMLSRYRGKTICPECKGTRLRKEVNYVKINGKSISELVLMSVDDLIKFFDNIKLNETEKIIANRLLTEIRNRLSFLHNVGLGYLTLNRNSNTLSGGESQRIGLATALGSSLTGSLYILDEPSIGLHCADTQKLISVLFRLRDLGNTVIVVEHDEEIIRASDYIIDMGPLAGSQGGNIVTAGSINEILSNDNSLTAAYLSGKMKIKVPEKRRKWKEYIEVEKAKENNLKNINVKFPLRVLTVVTGVSGSGKTSLVKTILFSALSRIYGNFGAIPGEHFKISGDIKCISGVEMIDQNPIGKSSRSNPVTYVKAYDDIRQLFAGQKLSVIRGYKPSFFSFNIDGGRCQECQGEGIVKIEMQFMADIELICESCSGKRFKEEVLEVEYKGKNIWDILEMTIDEAIDFFSSEKHNNLTKKIVAKLKPLSDVGLGYLKMGQS
ncbi:MAG TPA: excinuclease ABC subunit UvrA, partial [Bacteroidales bacterium]|nr:excinuclease ABC subunit UvrA [Bacteroidales bacterium]